MIASVVSAQIGFEKIFDFERSQINANYNNPKQVSLATLESLLSIQCL